MRERRSSPTPEGGGPLGVLLRHAAAGDESAFASLYELTSRRVYGLALRILRDPAAAEEAALDAYASIWSHAPSFDPQRGRPLAWMLTIARSKALDRLRARTRSGRGTTDLETALGVHAVEDSAPGPEAASVQAERSTQVRQALSRLPPDQRVAIERAYFEGLSHSEVARDLGEPLGTVKSRIRMGLSSLRRALSEAV